MLIGYGIGLPVNCYTAVVIVRSNFDAVIHSFTDSTYDPGPVDHRIGPSQCDRASRQGGSVPMDYVSARSDRANGAQQLHSAIDRHGVSVHGLRFRALWQGAALSALLHRGSDPDGAAYRQPHLAALFPLRTVRVGLAAADILEAPTDAN